jgi:hypothetical protein
VVGVAVELAWLGACVGVDLAHEVSAAGEHRVGDHRAAILGDETKWALRL